MKSRTIQMIVINIAILVLLAGCGSLEIPQEGATLANDTSAIFGNCGC
jgi:uncharacterized protein YceK